MVFDPTRIMVYNNSHAHTHTHYSTMRMEIGVRRMKKRMKIMMLSEMYVVKIMFRLENEWGDINLVWNEGSIHINFAQ